MVDLAAPRVGHRPCQSGVNDPVNFPVYRVKVLGHSHFESFDALNAHLERRCLERMDATLRGHAETIGQRMERDLDALLPLPPVPYDACEKQAGRVSSLSLVRYKTNDYSVPVAYGHRDVLVRGYVGQVVISCGSEIIARHPRSYDRDDFVYDSIHYLPLLERKAGALDQAAPLQGWDLLDEFGTVRRLLESRMGRGANGSTCRCSGCMCQRRRNSDPGITDGDLTHQVLVLLVTGFG